MPDETYALATVENDISPTGLMSLQLSDIRVLTGERPKGPQDIPGCDAAVLEAIGQRMPGRYSTVARLGAGVYPFLDRSAVPHLVYGNPRVMTAFGKYCQDPSEPIEELKAWGYGMLGLERDAMAGGTQWCMDPGFGIVATDDLVWAAVSEFAEEFGFAKPGKEKGRARIRARGRFASLQERIDDTQEAAWKLTGDVPAIDDSIEIILEPLAFPGAARAFDQVSGGGANKLSCIGSVEVHTGSLEIGLLAVVQTSGPVAVRDLEAVFNPDGSLKFMLNRLTTAAFARTDGMPALKIYLDSKGGPHMGVGAVSLSSDWQIRENLNGKSAEGLRMASII